MKRFVLTIALLFAVIAPLFALNTAAAVNVFQPCGPGSRAGNSEVCNDVDSQRRSGGNPIIHDIRIIINVLAILIGIAAVIVLIISGLRIMGAGGDAQAVASARGGIIYAIVGIVIAVTAELIVAFVLKNL